MSKSNAAATSKTGIDPIVIIGALFFVFGFYQAKLGIDTVLKIACELNNFESYLVTFAFYIS